MITNYKQEYTGICGNIYAVKHFTSTSHNVCYVKYKLNYRTIGAGGGKKALK